MAEFRRVRNPPNPFDNRWVDWNDGVEGNADDPFSEAAPPEVALELYEERSKTIITENDSPDVGFRFGLNPYRGCFHGCVYCYARPTHQYWGFGAGTDFERKIIVKIDAPELLDRELARGRTRGETLVLSGNTDCYQPIEANYGLTRRCLEVCLARRQPVGIITKGNVIRRDVELLAELTRAADANVTMSIAFDDEAMRRRFDPFAAPIDARFETMRRLADAGVPVGVGIAPIIPGVNEHAIPAILERARACGATSSFMALLRLPREVREVFDVSLQELLPDRAKKVRRAVAEMRHGRLASRMSGSGARWDAIQQLYDKTVARLGFNLDERKSDSADQPPAKNAQLSLFDG